MENNSSDIEIAMIRKVAGTFLHHPLQANAIFEADAEILDFKKKPIDYLILKSDGIHEEIREKLYEDPQLIGWMAVTVTMSDLAAVGSDPLGVLLSLQLPADFSTFWMDKFQQGVNAACAAYEVSILGGDTNFDEAISVSTTGVGTIFQTRPMFRKSILPGDSIYATGLLGKGNAFAYSRFFDSSLPVGYWPTARLKESKIIRKFATACIDTSDGFFPALSMLADINQVGFMVAAPLQNIVCDQTAVVSQKTGIPSWMFLAGPHGEYELLFAISPSMKSEFEAHCLQIGWTPVYIGIVSKENRVKFITEETSVACAPSEITNLFREAGGNIQLYFRMLKVKHQQWQQ